MTHFIEHLVFSNRKLVVALFAIATVFLGFQASQMRLDAGFEKNIPLNQLTYWNVELQEAYFSPKEAQQRYEELNKK